MLRRGRFSFLFLALLAVTAAAAAAEPPRWTLRLRGLSSNYDHQFVYPYLSTTYFRVDNGAGIEAAAELRLRPKVGIELSAGRLSMDGRYRVTRLQPVSFDPLVLREVTIFSSEGDFEIQPLAASLLFRPFRERRFDFYVGPQLAWTWFNVGVEGAQEREPGPGYGARIGVEYLFGASPWSLGVDYRHLELLHETQDRDLYGDIGLDVAALTIGYRLGSRPGTLRR